MSQELDVAVQLDETRDADNNGLGISGSNGVEDESEDEDEDVDFNPFFKESLSNEEASSSSGSEVEELEVDMVNSCHHRRKKVMPVGSRSMPQECTSDHAPIGCSFSGSFKVDDGGAHVSFEVGACDEKHNQSNDPFSNLEQHNQTIQEKENVGIRSGTDAVGDAPKPAAQMTITCNSRKPIIDLDDDDDAICKRTRARYSLVNCTLDELETFLQESDDDDLQNVDEEEEYRKFLAAVMQGENEDDKGNPDGNDDDEDNDADFEIEIEEALESDDDCVIQSNPIQEVVRSSRRPKTRQNRRQKSNNENQNESNEKENRQLRPLLPVVPVASMSYYPCMDPRYSTFNTSQNGFFAHQAGQLYGLMYEHVQLLIQIYSLCVLEPSRQHIASEVKGLLLELLHKRDLVLAWKKMPYPSSCFFPPFHPSTASDENRTCLQVEESRPSSQGNDHQGARWLPSVGGSVLSVLDVAPLQLVEKYFDDVSNAVREHQRRCVESSNIYVEKQPLFPLPSPLPLGSNHSVSKGDDLIPSNASAVSPNHKVTKKTLAATLVESTKKQSVALVPRQIAKLAQPFYGLFNPALFPHKPPSPAVANRVLFTDAEDKLLAMGILEHNNDWKAIKRLLPCKSEHQIFVRAKNRCSSKAPDNPIKAVRKMKTSPLTEVEKARIMEGLKIFKQDWKSIWQFIVPYRDPNLLCRQWRIANGIQKSYKGDPDKKEKRRIYELHRRRRSKAAIMENSSIESEEDDHTEYSGGQNGIGEDCMENNNETYLHEAFLADWRPASTGVISSKISPSSHKPGCLPGDIVERPCAVQEETVKDANQESQSMKGHTHEASVASEGSYQTNYEYFQPYIPHANAPSQSLPKPYFSESLIQSRRARKCRIPNLVKLAPELPPLKLPPAVRIISQASLRTPQLGSSANGASTSFGHQNSLADTSAAMCTSSLAKPVHDRVNIIHPAASSMSSQKFGLLNNGYFTKERGPEVDPQMHPLLFQTFEKEHLPCYQSNVSSRIPTFSFFPVAQHQINGSVFLNQRPPSPDGARLKHFKSKETAPTSSSLDFHPLLQRSNDAGVSLDTDSTDNVLSTYLELSRDGCIGNGPVSHAGATTDHPVAVVRPPTGADAVDLNLGIHLSPASKKRKVSSCGGADVNRTASSVNATEDIEGNEQTDIHSRGDYRPSGANTNGRAEESSLATSTMLLPNLDGGSVACTNDSLSELPLSGIVMEQEELSDSDEEMEEVEFECEEMTDSEGEGSANEPVVNALNKDQADSALLNTEGHVLRSSAAACKSSEGIDSQRKGKTSRSDLVGSGKCGSKSSWLSLNSCGFLYSPQSRTTAGGTPARSNSNRYSKKMALNTQNTPPGMVESSKSHSSPISPRSRKPRKQTSKNVGKDGKESKPQKM